MKQLEDIIKSPNGFAKQTMTLISKNDEGFLFRQDSNEWGTLGYHVFFRKINTQFNCESYPGLEAFGKWAWQFTTIESAKQRFNNLKQIKKENERATLQVPTEQS